MARNLSQKEINARKKVQAVQWRTTGTLGLASLGAFGASKAPGSAKLLKIVPKAAKINPAKATNASLGLGALSGGIGGAGSFNSAAISSAESRQRKLVVPPKKKIAKAENLSAFGIEH